MPLELSGHPQAVDIHVPVRLNGSPGVLGGDVLNKAFPPDIALQEYKPLVQPLLQPVLFGHDLHIFTVGYGAADVLLVKIAVGQFNEFHG